MKPITAIAYIASISVSLDKVAAFVAPRSTCTVRSEASTTVGLSEKVIEEIPEEPSTLSELFLKKQSKAIPFLERPPILDGSMAGDVGFDPLGFAKNEKLLMIYREAEVKHARLAMLAAAGWPLSELLDDKLARLFNIAPALDGAGKAPSISNNFKGVSDEFWIGILAFAAAVDLYGTYKSLSQEEDYFPGNLGFDPLQLYPQDPKEQKMMQLAEIKHGRTAMVAVLIYLLEETLTPATTINVSAAFS